MKTQALNLYIVDDNLLMAAGLRNYLVTKFGSNLNISTFLTGASVLEKIDKHTNIVILDYFLENENGNDVLKSIKSINPATEVIMLSSNQDMGIAIDAFRKGAKDYVVKGEKSWLTLYSLVYSIITYPVRIMVKEFGVSKFLAIFLLTFLLTGLAVFIAMRFIIN